MHKNSGNKSITNYEIVNDFLLVSFDDDTEAIIGLQILRDNCPCALCAGETDVFGNVYKGPPQKTTDSSYQVHSIEAVGYYGLRPRWKDGHNSGIFTAELIQKLV